MDKESIEKLLQEIKSGSTSVEDAVERLRRLPFEDLDFAKPDNHRTMRCGFSEAVYCPGKKPEQITRIVEALMKEGLPVLLTKADAAAYRAAKKAAPNAAYHETAKMVVAPGRRPAALTGLVVVATAGTTDIPVAEEAAVTAETMGANVERVFDVGVAGAHRLFAHREVLNKANAVVAVAGMEGALPSLVGGIVSCPVIAVPTSVGYGASFGGVTALLGMLNSCAPGVSVVNIDNGFGGGYIAATINRQTEKSHPGAT
ncbi:MAG: nickel pincer cofactor biosynthesis protein LarB [Actinomycetota bacterium]